MDGTIVPGDPEMVCPGHEYVTSQSKFLFLFHNCMRLFFCVCIHTESSLSGSVTQWLCSMRLRRQSRQGLQKKTKGSQPLEAAYSQVSELTPLV